MIFSKTSKYTWSVPAEAAAFFDKYKLGEYKFNNIQEVLNLVLNFLGLESFCSDRFKEVLLPVFMADSSIGVQVPLIFKTPGSDENIHTQNIVVTRKCSFDMSFFQLNGRGIHVEFYGEEGSDHGGLVRELMIGWKGKGIG